VIADEVGPSLRWATAQIERTERTGGDGGFSGGGNPSTAGAGASAGARQPDPVYGDEEPF
jgi:single-strand DNA-binding protein